ncbi:MAG: hypothetical protein ACXADC_01965 [Candidatus Thorarchaeota archaeon]|jgi:hypothetical protein
MTETDFVGTVRLLLSIDNMSYVQSQEHEINAGLDNDTSTRLFWHSNSVGSPIPFDLYAGETLYICVELVSLQRLSWRTPSIALDVPIDYLAPISMSEIRLQLLIVIASMLGFLGIIFIIARKRASRVV